MLQTMKHQRPSKFAYLLLALMSLFSFGGPFAIGRVVKGGASPDWPPDRAVEWATVIGVSAMVIVLMSAIVVYGIAHRRRLDRELARLKAEKSGDAS